MTVRRIRSPAHHKALAEELIDLAQDHMHTRDAALHRRGPRARRVERREFQNATWILAVAQVHATLASVVIDQPTAQEGA